MFPLVTVGNESRNRLSSSSEKLRTQRSTSPTSKGRPVSLSNLTLNRNGIIVHFWNGRVVNLESLNDESIGDALTTYITDLTVPMECIDGSTDKLIPWNTPVKDLIRRVIFVREIRKLSTAAAATPLTPISKKAEKRSSTSSDNNTLALQLWFSYCAQQFEKKLPNPTDQQELRCFLENLPSCVQSEQNTPTFDARSRSLSNLHMKTSPIVDAHDHNLIANWDKHRKHLLSLESNWDAFVNTEQPLSTREQQRQSAIWEFFVTELNYINYLRSILDTYAEPFNRVREQQFLELDGAKIFNNLEQIYTINLTLWFGSLHPVYCQMKETGKLLDAFMLETAFVKMPKLFTPYITYCMGLQQCQRYIKRAAVTNFAFAAFLKWADSVGSEHRELLWDRIAKPFKRITQYNLMLENIRKYCEDPKELQSIDLMHSGMEKFLKVLDHRMHQVEQRGRVESLEEQLIFPDCNENMDDDYQPFFSQYKRISLMEDIELPAPIILTVPEVRAILKLNPMDPNDPNYARFPASEMTLESNSQTEVKSPVYRSESTLDRSNSRSMDSELTDPNQLDSVAGLDNPDLALTGSVKLGISNSMAVLLSRWEPPPSYKVSKSNASILDRIRTTRMPTESRRTVPRSLLRKGYLRFRESQGKWTDATCFLLTDQFIIAKSHKRTNKYQLKVLRSPVRLDKLVVHKLNESGLFACAALDDFHMVNNIYTFHTTAPNCEEWCSLLQKTKERYLEMMRPEILFVTPHGSLPPHLFLRKCSSSSSHTSQASRSGHSRVQDRTPPNFSQLSNISTRHNPEPNTPVLLPRRPVRPSTFSPPRESTLVITDNRARPPFAVPEISLSTRKEESLRHDKPFNQFSSVSPKGSATKTSSNTWFVNSTPTANEMLHSLSKRRNSRTQSVRTIAINDTTPNGERMSIRLEKYKLQPPLPNDQFDSGSDILQEDRVISIDNTYGLKRSKNNSYSTPDLNGTYYTKHSSVPVEPNKTDLFVLGLSNTDSIRTRPAVFKATDGSAEGSWPIQSSKYRSTVHIIKPETQTTTTRC